MNSKNELDNQVNKTMESLDGLQRATTSPFLYAKIRMRLEGDNSAWTFMANKLSKPAAAFLIAAIILILNGWLLLSKTESGNENMQDQLTDLAYDYNFEPSAIADQNFVQP